MYFMQMFDEDLNSWVVLSSKTETLDDAAFMTGILHSSFPHVKIRFMEVGTGRIVEMGGLNPVFSKDSNSDPSFYCHGF